VDFDCRGNVVDKFGIKVNRFRKVLSVASVNISIVIIRYGDEASGVWSNEHEITTGIDEIIDNISDLVSHQVQFSAVQCSLSTICFVTLAVRILLFQQGTSRLQGPDQQHCK